MTTVYLLEAGLIFDLKEKFWKKIKQKEPYLHYFPTFTALAERVDQALIKFANATQEVLVSCSLPAELTLAR